MVRFFETKKNVPIIYSRCQILGHRENPRNPAKSDRKKMDLFSNEHNSATIGSILEILDVLSSPNHVVYNFGTFVR